MSTLRTLTVASGAFTIGSGGAIGFAGATFTFDSASLSNIKAALAIGIGDVSGLTGALSGKQASDGTLGALSGKTIHGTGDIVLKDYVDTAVAGFVGSTMAGYYRFKAGGAFQLWNATQSLWQQPILSGAPGAEILTWGIGEA